MPIADPLTPIRDACDLDMVEEVSLSIIMNAPGTYGPLNPRLLFAMMTLVAEETMGRE
jgi:hypothetical protein